MFKGPGAKNNMQHRGFASKASAEEHAEQGSGAGKLQGKARTWSHVHKSEYGIS